MSEAGNDDNTSALVSEAMPWIDSRLAEHGMTRTGSPGDPRVRPWATVISIPTDQGIVWFKAASPATAHEIGLYPLLIAEAPGLVLHPIATDPARAWMLLPDGGISLRHAVPADAQDEYLLRIVPRYAQLQRGMAKHVRAMLSIGVPDMQPHTMVDRFDEAIAAAEALARASGALEDIDAIRRVAAVRSRFQSWSETVASFPIAASIDHSDLHANNMLLPEGIRGRARIYDWGDSVIAHPFSTLLVMLRSLMDELQTTPNDPRLARVRDAYLGSFADVAGHDELVEIAEAACWTSVVTRALVHVRIIDLTGSQDPYLASAPIAWMKTFLNATWLE